MILTFRGFIPGFYIFILCKHYKLKTWKWNAFLFITFICGTPKYKKRGILFVILLLQSLGYVFVSGDLASNSNILLFIMTYLAIENENNIQTKKLSKIDKI